MSNENPGGSGDGNQSEKSERSQDSILAEMTRKTSQLSEKNAELNQKLDQLMQMVAESRQQGRNSGSQSATEEESALDDLIYKDPKAYARAVESRATKKAEELVNNKMQFQNETNAVLSQLAADYPELNDANSELTKKAVSIYNALPANQRSNPLAYKIAVRDAAADMGVLVKSKRKSGSDDFVSSGTTSSGERPSSKKSEQLDDKALAFAQMVGLNIKDEKVVKRIQERSKRKSWGKWE